MNAKLECEEKEEEVEQPQRPTNIDGLSRRDAKVKKRRQVFTEL